MEVRKGYIRTDAGVVPNDWNVANLKSRIAITHGFGFKGEFFRDTGHYRLTTPGHFFEPGGFRDIGAKQKYYVGPLPKGYVLKEGDLIIAMTEQAEGLLGSAALVPVSGEYLHNQRLGKVVLLSNEVSLKFLYRVFNTAFFRAHVRETAAGTKVKHTSPVKLLEIRVPLPPSTVEQEAIAGALADADAWIESLEQLIAKKRQIKQGAMQELLTGKRRLPGFSGEWRFVPISEVAEITTGSRNTQDSVTDGAFPFFVRSQKVERIDSYSFDGEAVLTAGDGVGTGKVFHYVNGKFDAHQRVYRLANFDKRINGYFFYLYFSIHFYSRIMQMTAKSSVDSVRREMIADMLVPLTPSKDEQNQVASVLLEMDSEVSELENKLTKARRIKASMMQELLTGRIRLVKPTAVNARSAEAAHA